MKIIDNLKNKYRNIVYNFNQKKDFVLNIYDRIFLSKIEREEKVKLEIDKENERRKIQLNERIEKAKSTLKNEGKTTFFLENFQFTIEKNTDDSFSINSSTADIQTNDNYYYIYFSLKHENSKLSLNVSSERKEFALHNSDRFYFLFDDKETMYMNIEKNGKKITEYDTIVETNIYLTKRQIELLSKKPIHRIMYYYGSFRTRKDDDGEKYETDKEAITLGNDDTFIELFSDYYKVLSLLEIE